MFQVCVGIIFSLKINFHFILYHTNIVPFNVPNICLKKKLGNKIIIISPNHQPHTKINQKKKNHHCRSIRLWFIMANDDHHDHYDVDDDDDFSWGISLESFFFFVGYIINNNCSNVMWCEIFFSFFVLFEKLFSLSYAKDDLSNTKPEKQCE